MINKKILIIQTAYLGDVILALPMAQTIKNHLPGSELDFLCIPTTASVLKNHPAIHSVVEYDKKGGDKLDKFIEALNVIREIEYDIVICPHRYFRSAMLTYYSESRVRIGFEENSLAFLLTNKVKYIKNKHEIYRNLELVKQIPGIEYDENKVSLNPELYPLPEQKEKIRHLAGKSNLISFAPCSKWYTKQLPVEKSQEIIRSLISKGYNVALLGSEADVKYGNELEKQVKDDSLINLCGKTSPVESYEVMMHSKGLITVDSAAQHLGAASGIPIVLIYGSTDISFGFYPLIGRYKIAEIDTLECRPCTDHGKDKCPLGHFKCMNDLNAEKIVEMIEELL